MKNPPPLTSSNYNMPHSAQQKTSGLAVTSMIMGIISLMGAALLVFPPILAVVFGHVSLSKCKKDPSVGGRGMGIAGLVMGYVAIIPGMIFSIGLFSAMAVPAFSKVRDSSQEKAIINNIRQLSAAADQFYLEEGKTRATFNDLVGGTKYIKSIPSVNGEVYPDTFTQDSPIIVRLKDGKTLRYP